MSGLAHFLESEGIATIVLGLVPHHVRAMQPPRALLVPFELGRPLGAPHDPTAQREVLTAAFALLDHSGPGPVIKTFDTEVTPSAINAEPWACPVSFPAPTKDYTLADRISEEVRLLQPWFELGYRQRGHTAADVSGIDIEVLLQWLARFLGDSVPTESPVPGRSLAESFKLGVEDLKAFYLESITTQPSTGSSVDVNSWFWEETAAGELLWQLRGKLREHLDDAIRLHAQFTLVPTTEVARRKMVPQ
ncbi:MAG: hypothetical protein OES38_13090 [Gammaproteobacteria bacterium]|nr:hypothetical protein [Gammaproteobacteria bacterium]